MLAYLWLGGRCRRCRARIALRYPLVELFTGLVFAAIAFRYGARGHDAGLAGLRGGDDRRRCDRLRPPDHPRRDLRSAVCSPRWSRCRRRSGRTARLMGARSSARRSARCSAPARSGAWASRTRASPPRWDAASTTGLAEGDAPPRPGSLDYWIWFPGIGFGDVKLLAMIGAVAGPLGALETILAASLAGLLLGVAWACRHPPVEHPVRLRPRARGRRAAGGALAGASDSGVLIALRHRRPRGAWSGGSRSEGFLRSLDLDNSLCRTRIVASCADSSAVSAAAMPREHFLACHPPGNSTHKTTLIRVLLFREREPKILLTFSRT